MENTMIVDKNTKQVMLENTEIRRIMSEGGIMARLL